MSESFKTPSQNREEVPEAEYFLLPILATDPLPFLFDSEGNPLDAEGNTITSEAQLKELPPEMQNLMADIIDIQSGELV